MSEAMRTFRELFPAKTPYKGEPRARGLAKKPAGMTDRDFRLSIRKAHMMGEHGLLCGADHKAKISMPFLVTRNWQKVTCGKCVIRKPV